MQAEALEVDEHGGFQQVLSQALGAVSQSQHTASRLQREVQMDNPTVGLEETMVAMQKAQLGFQATLQVRNRLVQAVTALSISLPVRSAVPWKRSVLRETI